MFKTVAYLTTCVLVSSPTWVQAQTCPVPAQPYFEFQVERPAAFINDTTVSPRPLTARPPAPPPRGTLVSFIVDTLGRPDPTTYQVIRDVDPALAEDGRAVVGKWRYRPALVRGCAVPQLVQTLIERVAK